jgi:membrane protease YdiL (CAAX protease family)
MIFRGIIFNCLRRVMKLKIAALLSAVVFGVYHGNVVQGVYAFLMGLLLVYGYEYFGSFIAAAAIHVAANVIAYILGTAGTAVAGLVNWPACLICLALSTASLVLMSRQKKIFFAKGK